MLAEPPPPAAALNATSTALSGGSSSGGGGVPLPVLCGAGRAPEHRTKRRRRRGEIEGSSAGLEGGASNLLVSPANGFVDHCRVCNAEIFRKGQSRPRICLSCEKKKAQPITDVCKICNDPIVRSNVRKARICYDCKRNRDRSRTASEIQAAAAAAAANAAVAGRCDFFPAAVGGAGGVPAVDLLPVGTRRRVQLAQARAQFVAQWEHVGELLAKNGFAAPFTSEEPVDYSKCRPKLSNTVKINTACFPSAEALFDELEKRMEVNPVFFKAENAQNDTAGAHIDSSEDEDEDSDENWKELLQRPAQVAICDTASPDTLSTSALAMPFLDQIKETPCFKQELELPPKGLPGSGVAEDRSWPSQWNVCPGQTAHDGPNVLLVSHLKEETIVAHDDVEAADSADEVDVCFSSMSTQ